MKHEHSIIIGSKQITNYLMAIYRLAKDNTEFNLLARGNHIPMAIRVAHAGIDNLPEKWKIKTITIGISNMPFRQDPSKTPLPNPPKETKVPEISITLSKV